MHHLTLSHVLIVETLCYPASVSVSSGAGVLVLSLHWYLFLKLMTFLSSLHSELELVLELVFINVVARG